MNRSDLQILSNTRLREANVLLAAGEYSGAYYLAGYSLECAIKACIARKTQQHDFPDKVLALASYSHSFEKLLQPAGLEDHFEAERRRNPSFATSWRIVKEWTETSRYEEYSERDAVSLITALQTQKGGVLLWIQRFW